MSDLYNNTSLQVWRLLFQRRLLDFRELRAKEEGKRDLKEDRLSNWHFGAAFFGPRRLRFQTNETFPQFKRFFFHGNTAFKQEHKLTATKFCTLKVKLLLTTSIIFLFLLLPLEMRYEKWYNSDLGNLNVFWRTKEMQVYLDFLEYQYLYCYWDVYFHFWKTWIFSVFTFIFHFGTGILSLENSLVLKSFRLPQ